MIKKEKGGGYMRILSLNELSSTDFFIRDLEIFPESWTKRNSFTKYENTPRPCSAFFLVATDIRVTFFPKRGVPITASEGDLVYIPSEILYHVVVEGGSENRIDTYTLNFRLSDEAGKSLLFSNRITLIAKDSHRRLETYLGELNNEMHRVTLSNENKGTLQARAIFYRILDGIMQKALSKESFYPIRIGMNALQNEWNQNVPIATYAKLSGVSETYFYRCFRKSTGKSPVEYRNALRLSNAETMLRKTDMKISEISETVGFEDQFYFCRIFSSVFGTSPQKYRLKALTKEK